MVLFSHLTVYLTQFGGKETTDWIGEYHRFPSYSPLVRQFCHEVEGLVHDYPQVADYPNLLKNKGIQSFEDLEKTDLSLMELVTVLVGFVRLERFNEGLLWRALKDGQVQHLLERMRELDN